MLAGHEDHSVTTYARCVLHLARDAPSAATSLARRRLRALDGGSVEWAALVDVLASAGSLDAELPALDDRNVIGAYIHRARGRASSETAVHDLEAALVLFGELGLPYEAARTRLLPAGTVAGVDRETAVAEASAALRAFDALGADRDADAAAGLLRSLGAKAARSAPRGIGVLTRREREILILLGEGLSNPAISERLYISRRTVEHHVASVLTKLGLSGRAEAAAYAMRHGEK